ncbi:GNAT family N-acetyltransferase [bacterium BFN5]|nr:GNAT family N-acetyltransferase [bacterium BFN5]
MIRKATIHDLESIMAIVQETIAEMHGYNNFQWDENYPQAKDFVSDIEKGNLFVAVRDDKLAGFICINHEEPAEYQGLAWSLTGKALVIHRMSVGLVYRNAGVGAEFMQLADKMAQQAGIHYLKTDTFSVNTKAQQLFRKSGYNFVGEMSFLGKERTA